MNLDQIEARLKLPLAELFRGNIDEEEKRLLTLCHPDRHGGSRRAEELFKRVQELAALARKPALVLKGKKHSYSIGSLIAEGDVAFIYDCGDYVLKVARVPIGNEMLTAEYANLAKIHKTAGDTTYRHYFPLPVESFEVNSKFKRRVNVFTKKIGDEKPDSSLAVACRQMRRYTLADIIEKHKRLSGRHIAWLFKRLLVGLGFAHRQGIVHGAVLPQHLWVDAVAHGVQLIGWGQSVGIGKPLPLIVKSHEAWYPPEVKAKQTAAQATDIYMAACCMRWAMGKQADDGYGEEMIRHFLRSCELPGKLMRGDDAWKLHDEFEELLRGVYGAPKFVELAM